MTASTVLVRVVRKVFLIIGLASLMVITFILNGLVVSVMWGWFVVPTFGAPVLDLVPAIGIVMMVSFMTHQEDVYEKEDQSMSKVGKKVSYAYFFSDEKCAKIAYAYFLSIAMSQLMLLFGWIVHLFM